MFDKKKIDELVLISLIADSYSLGAHWVYDESQLQENTLNWDELNAPLAIWHEGKTAGDFTHYGDQVYWLHTFLKDKDSFDADEYFKFWVQMMSTYQGYIDGASRETLENIEENKMPYGSNSTDMSIVGRITPLLKVSNSRDEFLQNVETFVKLTHNSPQALEASQFFAELLLLCLEGLPLEDALLELKKDSNAQIQKYIDDGQSSKTQKTFQSIRSFGPACDVTEGFPGVIHLLLKYYNVEDMLQENAKSGGDTSARSMIASVIFMANRNIDEIPVNWMNLNVIYG